MRTKYLPFLLLLLTAYTPLSAQVLTEVSGTVRGTFNGERLAGATIDFDSSLQTVTNINGEFRINVPSGVSLEYRVSKHGFIDRVGSFYSIPTSTTDTLNLDLININHPDFDLHAYKRILFDFQAAAPFFLRKFTEEPIIYIDERADTATGAIFNQTQIDTLVSLVRSLFLTFTSGLWLGSNVLRGTSPPKENVIIFRLNSSLFLSAASGTLGPSCRTVEFKTPQVATIRFFVRHETAHALGFSHTNGVPSLMTSFSTYYKPEDPFIYSDTLTAFDLLAARILMNRPQGLRSAIHIDSTVEFVPGPVPVIVHPRNNDNTESYKSRVVFLWSGQDVDYDPSNYIIQIATNPEFEGNVYTTFSTFPQLFIDSTDFRSIFIGNPQLYWRVRNDQETVLWSKTALFRMSALSRVDIQQEGYLTPIAYTLSQNYPNPFNPSTNIRFSLKQRSNVKLVIYNLLGQVVSNLIDKTLPTGEYNIRFDANTLPTGIYIYRLTANQFVQSRRMLLLK